MAEKIIDPIKEIADTAKILNTVTPIKNNDDDLAGLKRSATIQYLIACVLDLKARVEKLEGAQGSVK